MLQKNAESQWLFGWQLSAVCPSLNQTPGRWAWPGASWCHCCSPGPASAPPSLCPSPPPSAGWPETAAGWSETAAGWPETAAGWPETVAGCASWMAYRTECRPPTAESDRSKLGKRMDIVGSEIKFRQRLQLNSVADPDPSVPYVFRPPGSGGSGSGSFHHQAKIVRKNLIPR